MQIKILTIILSLKTKCGLSPEKYGIYPVTLHLLDCLYSLQTVNVFSASV